MGARHAGGICDVHDGGDAAFCCFYAGQFRLRCGRQRLADGMDVLTGHRVPVKTLQPRVTEEGIIQVPGADLPVDSCSMYPGAGIGRTVTANRLRHGCYSLTRRRRNCTNPQMEGPVNSNQVYQPCSTGRLHPQLLGEQNKRYSFVSLFWVGMEGINAN